MNYSLIRGPEGLALHSPAEKKYTPLIVDFKDYQRLFRNSQVDLLKRALGKLESKYSVLECTMGLASDAFRLAEYGYNLISLEENKIIFQLVEDALARFADGDDQVLRNWRMYNKRAQDLDVSFFEKNNIHTIYLDPMFPESKSASGKGSQILQDLCDTDPNSIQALVDWAFLQPVAKIVIKRPKSAPSLKGKFSHQLIGKTVRWDVYAIPKIRANST